ncbi:hypothetical protein GCM10007423_63770 [Dyadobacter endophyticus]|uniref:CobQ/CobB/MinD/ParA nucleotide binding domain-containing protein n=1 Tax=Dyadobacter endophyticus TaxID=1749036 RepID=A0ABQ1ZDK9_9BACT|nr:hypothetical protein [Dyadobacter endophyticus]GGH55809.1 hypothetical protein GCM10007423_63770 [Dyadobacter endophyticus]
MKKQVVFIAQSKGGVGKSFITWFIARNKKDSQAAFIDLDKSTRTSDRLKSIVGEKRVLELSIIDGNLKLDREGFINIFEKISKAKTDEWFVDLGAPESDELRSFFANDVPAEELKEMLEELGIDLKIFVVLAGEDAFHASVNFYKELTKLTGDNINVIAVKNEGTFGSLESQEHGDALLSELGIDFVKVGKMPVGNSANEIISLMSGTTTEEKLTLAGKRSLRKVTDAVSEVLL